MTTPSNEYSISLFSRRSLRLELLDGNKVISSSATGFLFEYEGSRWLVTNLHVVTGINQETGAALCLTEYRPRSVRVILATESGIPSASFTIDLYDDNLNRLYRGAESPLFGNDVYPNEDVAVLPLPSSQRYLGNSLFYQFDSDEHPLKVTDTLFIVGYPGHLRMRDGEPPVWTRGSVASEPNVPGGRAPLLIDARTRKGQSGSPVIAYRRPLTHIAEGGFTEAYPEAARLVGVYSGRTENDSDLGRVWSPESIRKAIFYG